MFVEQRKIKRKRNGRIKTFGNATLLYFTVVTKFEYEVNNIYFIVSISKTTVYPFHPMNVCTFKIDVSTKIQAI
jgi:hypothetical protein